MSKAKWFLGAVVAGTMLMFAGQAHATNVGVELALLLDVSGSISTSEYNLQREGYARAFENATVQQRIASNAGGIAVNMVMWSSSNQQSQVIAWRQVQTAAEANQLAADIRAITRPFSGGTAPQAAMNYQAATVGVSFATNGFDGAVQIVDVSGDGSGENSTSGRDALIAAGVDRINGLVIGGSQSVFNYYVNNVQFGVGSFVSTAATFDQFADAILAKIAEEVKPIPIPAALPMLGAAVAGIFFAARRRQAASAAA